MKKRISALLILLASVLIFAVSCNTGGGETTPELPESYIFTPGGKLYVVHDGSESATGMLSSLTASITGVSGIIPSVRAEAPANAEHILLLGDTGHALSKAAYDILNSSGYTDGYALYSDGASLAVVWTREYPASQVYEYMLDNLFNEATLTLAKGYVLVTEIDVSIHEAQLIEESYAALKGEISDAAIEAIRTLYTLYTDDFYIWLANLYDPEIGAFYYSNSARDNQPFLPDIESTAQALSILKNGGMFRGLGGWTKVLPEDVCRKIAQFAYDMQDEDGYFYHVQWGKNINTSRRGRDFKSAKGILDVMGIKPKYKLATDILADDTEDVSCLVKPLGNSVASAVSAVISTSTDYLSSEEKFIAYLGTLDFANNSYSSGHQLSSTANQIKAAGLAQVCIDYLNARQNPENGFWEQTVTYQSMNGFLKISSTYNGLGGHISYLDRAIDSIFTILLGEEMPTTLPQIYNLTNGINNALNNLSAQGDTALYNSTRQRIRNNAEEIAKTLYKKIATFRCDDGSFSYYVDSCSPTSQGCLVAIKCKEGDVNAGSMAFGALSGFFSILGLTSPRAFTPYDAEEFCDLLSNATPVQKIELPDPEPVTYEDGELDISTSPALKAGELNVIRDPREGGDYVMELISTPGNSDAVRVVARGVSSNSPSCFVYQADMCFARNAANGTVFQLNTSTYLINVRISGDNVSFHDCSLTSGDDRFTNDMGISLKVGEWFNFRIEYYLGDADNVRIVTYINGEKRFVSDNYYGKQPTLVDQPNEPQPVSTNKGIQFFAMKASDVTAYIDNVLVDSTADVYVPGDAEDKFKDDESTAANGPLYTFDESTDLPTSIQNSLQSGILDVIADPRSGATGNVLRFKSAEGLFEYFNVVNHTQGSKGYKISMDMCYTDFNATGVSSRIALDELFNFDMRREADGTISVLVAGQTSVIHRINQGEWFTFSATLTATAGGLAVSVSIGDTVIYTNTVAAAKATNLRFTTLKAFTHTTYVDNVLFEALN